MKKGLVSLETKLFAVESEELDRAFRIGRVLAIARRSGFFEEVFRSVHSDILRNPEANNFLTTDHRQGGNGISSTVAGLWMPSYERVSDLLTSVPGQVGSRDHILDEIFYPTLMRRDGSAQVVVGLTEYAPSNGGEDWIPHDDLAAFNKTSGLGVHFKEDINDVPFENFTVAGLGRAIADLAA